MKTNIQKQQKCQRSGEIYKETEEREKIRNDGGIEGEKEQAERERGDCLPDDNFCCLSSPRRPKNGVKMRNVSNEFWRWQKGQWVTSVWDIWSEETHITASSRLQLAFDSRWQLLLFLVKSLGNSMHMQMHRRIESHTGRGKIDFPCLTFKFWGGPSWC